MEQTKILYGKKDCSYLKSGHCGFKLSKGSWDCPKDCSFADLIYDEFFIRKRIKEEILSIRKKIDGKNVQARKDRVMGVSLMVNVLTKDFGCDTQSIISFRDKLTLQRVCLGFALKG